MDKLSAITYLSERDFGMTDASKKAGGPLAGLRVIDAGTMIAGPLGATQLADFGADVIKVELPEIGDSMRHWSPMRDKKSLWWKVIGRNKNQKGKKFLNV